MLTCTNTFSYKKFIIFGKCYLTVTDRKLKNKEKKKVSPPPRKNILIHFLCNHVSNNPVKKSGRCRDEFCHNFFKPFFNKVQKSIFSTRTKFFWIKRKKYLIKVSLKLTVFWVVKNLCEEKRKNSLF